MPAGFLGKTGSGTLSFVPLRTALSEREETAEESSDPDGICSVASVEQNAEFRNAIWSTIHGVRRELGAKLMATVREQLQPGYKEGYVSALMEVLGVASWG